VAQRWGVGTAEEADLLRLGKQACGMRLWPCVQCVAVAGGMCVCVYSSSGGCGAGRAAEGGEVVRGAVRSVARAAAW